MNSTTLKNGEKYDYKAIINAASQTVTVTYKGVALQYDLLLTTAAQTEKEISEMTIGGEVAKISGSKISAEIEKTNDRTAVPFSFKTASSVKSVTMTAPGAGSGAAATVTLTDAVSGDTTTWTGTTDFTKGATITVTAADDTTKQYLSLIHI